MKDISSGSGDLNEDIEKSVALILSGVGMTQNSRYWSRQSIGSMSPSTHSLLPKRVKTNLAIIARFMKRSKSEKPVVISKWTGRAPTLLEQRKSKEEEDSGWDYRINSRSRFIRSSR
ncbi:unnamed protein product [Ilex paraguariensis]|uniref:Uncharacterized protein n=1 Tax=Ilex paraguariensis TaxID=185542 RepID=A0ABC8RHL6_9AQUA